MKSNSKIAIFSFEEVLSLINPLHDKLAQLENKLDKNYVKPVKKYYRNKDLKLLFGISQNTIVKYRINGNLPFTTIGDVYLYPVKEIEKILSNNLIG